MVWEPSIAVASDIISSTCPMIGNWARISCGEQLIVASKVSSISRWEAVLTIIQACILTVDTWSLGWRHDDVATSNYAFYKGIACDLGLSDHVFMSRMKDEGIQRSDLQKIGERWVDSYWHGVPWSWDDLPRIIKLWKDVSGGKPFGVKGIQRPEVSLIRAYTIHFILMNDA